MNQASPTLFVLKLVNKTSQERKWKTAPKQGAGSFAVLVWQGIRVPNTARYAEVPPSFYF
ncbi:MAG: hypothetical protein BGO68_03685 [Candidatus Amoebophilus sp. 36-38]|nr:MAG: hypothetical protein BGO68_03685 [Candidatus Amoebophilus sp. 36-38]